MTKTSRPTLRRLALATALAVLSVAASAADPKAAQFYEDALVRFEKKDYAGAIIQLKNSLKIDDKQLSVQVLLGKALLANAEVAAAEVAFNEALRLGVNRAEVVVPLAQSLVGQARQAEVVAAGSLYAPAGLPPGVRAELLLVQAAAHSDLGTFRDALKAIDEARAINPDNPESWLSEVPVRIRVRQFKEATVAADRALALAPNSAQAHYLRGSIAHAQGQITAAVAAYDRALGLAAEHQEARIARAGLFMDMGRLADVQREVIESRRLAPRDPRGAYLGALLAERNGDAKAARAALADITLLLDPIPVSFMRYRPQILILGGLAHFGLGQNEKARPYLEAAIRQQPDIPAAKLLAQIYIGEGNVDRALETLEAFVKGNPGDIQGTVLLATAQMSKGRPARAAQVLQEALKTTDTPRLRAFLGLSLVGGGKMADALVELEKAYLKDPTQTAAGAALVSLYVRNKQPARAMAIADGLVKRMPKDAQFHALQGMVRAETGDIPGARQAFEQAIKINASFLPAQLELARLDSRARRDEAATKRLGAILAIDEKHVEAMVELGLIAERQGNAAEATRLLEKAADLSPTKALYAPQALVDLHLRGARIDSAKEALKKLIARAPDDLSVLMTEARVRLAAQDLAAARQTLTRASRTAEFDAQLQSQIALLQLSANDAKGALYSATKALQGQPDYLPAKALMVDANIRLGDLTQAEQGAREIATQQPKLALGSSLQGDVALARAQAPVAVAAYRRAHQIEPTPASLARLFRALEIQDASAARTLAEGWLKSHPGDTQVRRLLADALARAGDFAAARKSYEMLLTLAPDDAETLNNLANVLILAKDAQALSVAEKAMARKPGAAHIIGTAGWAAFQAGQADRALQLLRDARLRDPNNADTRFFLGTVLVAKGRTAEARDELQGALRSGSGFVNAKAAQDLLKTLN